MGEGAQGGRRHPSAPLATGQVCDNAISIPEGGALPKAQASAEPSQTALDLDVLRNTRRKVLRSGAIAFSNELQVRPRPKPGAWTDELDRILAASETKAAGSTAVAMVCRC